MNLNVGDLIFLKENIPFNIQEPDLYDLSIGILLKIQEADGSELHQNIIFETYRTLNEIDDPDELINSKQYKVHFLRNQTTYWFPEFYIEKMFQKKSKKNKINS